MNAVLVTFKSDGERRSFSLPKDVTLIGRREDCDLRIPLGEVSRKHCRFIKDGDGLRVEDLGSSNGTFHNGVRVQEAVLAAGDVVQVGPVAFVVQIDGVPAEEDIQPAAAEATSDQVTTLQEHDMEAAVLPDDGEAIVLEEPAGSQAGGSGIDDIIDFNALESLEGAEPKDPPSA